MISEACLLPIVNAISRICQMPVMQLEKATRNAEDDLAP